MNFTLILEKRYKSSYIEKLPINNYNGYKIYLDNNLGNRLKLLNQKNAIVLVADKILSRKNKFYLTIKKYVKKNKVGFIEVGLNKSNVENSKTFSDTLIHGLKENSWEILAKIVRNNK